MAEIRDFEAKRIQGGTEEGVFALFREMEAAKRVILTYVVELQY
jgi:hypothetical protein